MIALTAATLALAPSLAPLRGIAPPLVSTSEPLDLGEALEAPGTTLLVLGTYPADFNMIEYTQRLTHYLPALKEKGVSRVLCTVNGKPSSCSLLAELVGLPPEVELIADEAGDAGRAFGVSRGWLPDTDEFEVNEDLKVPISPYAKLFGMLLGLGAGTRCLPLSPATLAPRRAKMAGSSRRSRKARRRAGQPSTASSSTLTSRAARLHAMRSTSCLLSADGDGGRLSSRRSACRPCLA